MSVTEVQFSRPRHARGCSCGAGVCNRWCWRPPGITLSGGQKARVSLARAVYSQADVYATALSVLLALHCVVTSFLGVACYRFVMDDPTAAVDAWVGQHLFEQCVVGIMGNKTRVYVTNHIDQAKAADLVVLMEDGEIADQGTYEQLSTRSSKFRELLEACVSVIVCESVCVVCV